MELKIEEKISSHMEYDPSKDAVSAIRATIIGRDENLQPVEIGEVVVERTLGQSYADLREQVTAKARDEVAKATEVAALKRKFGFAS